MMLQIISNHNQAIFYCSSKFEFLIFNKILIACEIVLLNKAFIIAVIMILLESIILYLQVQYLT